MNIGIDVRCLMERNFSGVGTYTQNLLRAIFNLDGYNQYFLFYNNWHKREGLLPEFPGENVRYISRHIPNKLFNLSIGVFARPVLNKLLPVCDIFWVPSNNFISWSDQPRKIITCHDLSWKLLPRFYSSKGRLWHKLIKLERLYQQADIILAVSENTKNDLIDLDRGLAGKIRVTPLGVDKKIVSLADRERVRRHYQLPDKFILYIGNIEPRKNLPATLASFEKIKSRHQGLRLVIVGGTGWHQGYYRKIIRLIKNNPKVKYLGYLPEADKFPLLSLAKVFLYPSFYEGFGLPPLEAMSQGCPVVVSNNSSLPEVVGAAGLLIDPHNVNQITAAVDEILTDEDLREDLINKGKKRALQFEWTKTAQQMISIFNNL